LRTSGFAVVSTTDGLEALALLERESFDAVVLDLRMPRVDGRTVFRRLRASGNRVPVLIASAFGARPAQLELGAEGSIEKPFDPDVLIEEVARLVHLVPAADNRPRLLTSDQEHEAPRRRVVRG
jgi:two-component system response regulator MprA